jgi:CxxC motif-containing protein (DUF1111 family)
MALALVAALSSGGCRVRSSGEGAAGGPATLGLPREGLTVVELADFAAGKAQFQRQFAVADGLGPHFNAASCLDCHGTPTSGGHGDLQHAARIVGVDGDVIGMPAKAIPGFAPLQPRPGQPVSTHKPPPLYGLGLVEAVPDAWLADHCGRDPALGIGGKTNVHPRVGRVGRFGFKAHAVTLADFIGNALTLEMGVTNPVEPDPRRWRDDDAVADPEVSTPTVAQMVSYVRGLRPPGRERHDRDGEALFRSVGCATCHRPETAPGVEAFSDFCLHDLGRGFDNGLTDLNAGPSQWRTAPLWGLRFRDRYFHDNRGPSLDAAIRMHDGEAAKVRERYTQLPSPQQAQLVAFLRTL